MDAVQMENKILSLLERFTSLEHAAIQELVFSDGSYSYANKSLLDFTLQALVSRGAVLNQTRFGYYRLAEPNPAAPAKPTPSPTSGRMGILTRTQGRPTALNLPDHRECPVLLLAHS